ncbi:polygalacturonase QRT3-like [Syzygium oleosum]|uniref:polygalacturonase QRT3-like n=1 Tax=Syzygium oleosum TaxID=219896 RepID=UPI0011D24F3E|nr:polygalacturonase QRT3-like [Syzygium oleosum]
MMAENMARRRSAFAFAFIRLVSCLMVSSVYGEYPHLGQIFRGHYGEQMQKSQEFKASVFRRDLVSLAASSVAPSTQPGSSSPRGYSVTSYGADPTGNTDSTDAFMSALADAVQASGDGVLMEGITNLGGAQISLEGGNYMISHPLRFPTAGVGNIVIHGGTLHASDDFPTDGYLIDLSAPSSSKSSSSYNFEYVTFRDLMLDSNYRGGGILVPNSLRTSIDNCYIAHFTSNGILVQGGHETYIRNSFLGQHITAGGDPGERNFSGTAINLMGNDNAVTDVVIFSAAIGIMVSGQANVITGVHCYNKATGFGGTGIYLKSPGNTQTRILNCYLDYTGIVSEDPVQIDISNCFFLGDAYIVLKSINGVANGVNIRNNMFSGSNKGIDILQLDQSNGPFKEIDQVVIDANNANGMTVRSTVARGSAQGNGTSWTVDFNSTLLFPDLINYIQYSLRASGGSFPNHCVRNVSRNSVVVESDVAVSASVFVMVEQGK